METSEGGMPVRSDGRTIADVAFEKIVEEHHAEIGRYLRRAVPHRADADALFEETFVRAFRARRSLPAAADVRAWLFAIATRLCRTHRSVRRSVVTKASSVRPQASDGASMEGEVPTIEGRSPLEDIIGGLPLAQRLALAMRKLHDLDYAAIADCLDCPAETARTHVLEAMRKIRRGLEAGGSHHGSDDRRDDDGRSAGPAHPRRSRAGLG
jgi:RNA polymerase sigma-70 factor (ECF subfamily)